MTEYNSPRVRPYEFCHDEKSVSRPTGPDHEDEAGLWAQFEEQFEDDWNDDGYSFAEDGEDELAIPPKAGALIDYLPALEPTGRGHVLSIVKRLIEQEISKR